MCVWGIDGVCGGDDDGVCVWGIDGVCGGDDGVCVCGA